VPAIAVVLGFLVLGEPIHPGQVLGGVVIIIGVALTRTRQRRAQSRAASNEASA
jgi:drug/metabolite transporter (DMT)-like permease